LLSKKKEREQQSNQQKRVVFQIMLHYSFYILISKTQNPKIFPTFALAPL